MKKYTQDKDIEFLVGLVIEAKLPDDSIIVEIGTASLGTTVHIAKTAPNSSVVTIDTYNSPKVRAKDFEVNFKLLQKLEIYNVRLIQSTSEAFGNKYKGAIDFLWIDGYHAYEFVKKDIEIWGSKLKTGCIICGHDYTGHDGNVTRAVDELVRDSDDYEDFNVYNNLIWYAKRK